MRVRPRTKTQRGMRKEFAHMKRCDIRKLLHERFPNAWLHITLCCIRYGPALKHREDRHCGEHTQNLRCCIEGLGIHTLMKECHKYAMELWASGVNNICYVHLRWEHGCVSWPRRHTAACLPAERLQQQRPLPHRCVAKKLLALRAVPAKCGKGHLAVCCHSRLHLRRVAGLVGQTCQSLIDFTRVATRHI